MSLFDIDEPYVLAESEHSRNRENKGRLAHVSWSAETTGMGVVEFNKRINFGLTYTEKPWMQYGAEIDLNQVRDALSIEGDGDLPGLPTSMAYVTDWDTDDRGHYIGAWVAVSVVYSPYIPVDAQITITHLISFAGAIALKDMPLLDEE